MRERKSSIAKWGGSRMRVIFFLGLWLLAAPAIAQEKFAGTSTDVRTILNFKVSTLALQKLLPAGWELKTVGSGPLAGTNLKVTFADQLIGTDGAGKQTTPIQYVIFSVPVKRGFGNRVSHDRDGALH